MKVLFINTVCGGSTGQIIRNIVKNDYLNDECVVAFGRGRPFEDIKTVKIGTKISILFHALLSRLLDYSGFGSYFATLRFLHFVKRFNPDLIWLHNLHGYYLNVPLLFKYLKKRQTSVYWTIHDCWPITGHCAYFSAINCDGWLHECAKCPLKKNYPKTFLSFSKRNLARKQEAFSNVPNMKLIVPSEWLKNLISQSNLKKYEIQVVPNKIDLNIFKNTISTFREEHGLADKKIILGVANVWEERKGLKYFLTLSQELPKNYAIILVGLNRKQIKQLSRSNVICFGRLSITDLVKLYSTADLYFNPSVEETFGMTTLEALSCGTKTLVFKGTACEEIIKQFPGLGFSTDCYNNNLVGEIESII